MRPFAERLVQCAHDACVDPGVRALLGVYRTRIAEPERATARVDLSHYPTPQSHRWDKDRGLILEMIREEAGVDLSETLGFEAYQEGYRRRQILVTRPTRGLERGRINLIPVPEEEILTFRTSPVAIGVADATRPIVRGAWVLRFVEEPMSDALSGFALLESLSFLHGVIVSDMVPPPEADMLSMADALRAPDTFEHAVAIRVCLAQTRMELARKILPRADLFRTPPGTTLHGGALEAYAELTRGSLDAWAGPAAHKMERTLRQTIATDVALAHCLPLPLLYQAHAETFGSP